jgi:hypothetical protein
MTPNPPSVPVTDDELGELLAETFAAHEDLADPDRAIGIAATPGHPRRSGRVLLGAAAAVVLVAGGTTYALSRGGGSPAVTTGPPASAHQPPLPPLQTDAHNKALAAQAADHVAHTLRVHAGAHPSGRIAAFDGLGTSSGLPGYTVARTRWWTVAGASSARSVAHWYAGHPTQGFVSESGSSFSTSAGTGSATVYGVDLDQPHGDGLPPRGVSIEVDTVALPHGSVGVRATVMSIWQPARPRSSYVQDATSIDVHVTHTRYGQTPHTTHRSFTVRDPARIRAAEVTFDRLQGTGPVVVSCPLMLGVTLDRIVFHTPTGDLTVTAGGTCVDIGTVHRGGRVVGPGLAFVSELTHALAP